MRIYRKARYSLSSLLVIAAMAVGSADAQPWTNDGIAGAVTVRNHLTVE